MTSTKINSITTNIENDSYEFLKYLGCGGFGRTLLYKNKINNQNVCIKQIDINSLRNRNDMRRVKDEIYIISQLKHPRIIKFLNYFITENFINIVMEYAPNGTLREFLNEQLEYNGILNVERIQQVFCDILIGLEYLHIRHVIHRDLKPENLLIGNDNRIKIADFGISFIHDYQPDAELNNKSNSNDNNNSSNGNNLAGTLTYIAPELIKFKKFNFKTDIWALGCILHELCTKRHILTEHMRDLTKITDTLMNYNGKYLKCYCSNVNHDFKELYEKMLIIDPNERISLPSIIRNHKILIHYYNLYFDYQ